MKNPFETFIQCAKVGRGMDRPGLTAAFLSIHKIYRGQVPLIQHRMKFPMPYGKFNAVVSVIDLPATRGCFYRSSTPVVFYVTRALLQQVVGFEACTITKVCEPVLKGLLTRQVVGCMQ